MTSISGISDSNITQATTQLATQTTTQMSRHRHGGPLAAAARALGISGQDLMSEVGSGKSLADVAKEKGVSTDDLAAAIKSALPQDVQASDDVDSVVSSIITRQGPPPPPPGGGRGFRQPDTSVSGVYGDSLTSSQQTMLNSLSSLLGTDSDSLLDKLRSGQSLNDLVSAGGVSTASLASILQNGLLVDTQA